MPLKLTGTSTPLLLYCKFSVPSHRRQRGECWCGDGRRLGKVFPWRQKLTLPALFVTPKSIISHPGLDPAQLIGIVVIGEIMCCRCFWKQAPSLKGRECFSSAYSVSVNFNTKTLAAQYLGHSRPHDANTISHMS